MQSRVLLAAAVLLLGPALGQAQTFPASFAPVYHALKTTVQSGTAEVLTLQNPMTNGKQVNIKGLFVSCALGCLFQVEMDGTAATGTAVTPVKATKKLGTSRALVYSASTTTSPRFSISYTVPAGTAPYPLDFGGNYSLPGDGTSSNFTVRSLTTTGTITIFLQWQEP